MTGPDLAALREKAEAAPPGPWVPCWSRPYKHGPDVAGQIVSTTTNTIVLDFARRKPIFDGEPIIRYLLSVSPDVLLSVLSRLARAEAENERYARALCEIANGDYYGPAEDRALLALGGDDEEASP